MEDYVKKAKKELDYRVQNFLKNLNEFAEESQIDSIWVYEAFSNKLINKINRKACE